MHSFTDIQNPQNENKIYIAVTYVPTETGINKQRQVFVKYNGDNRFTYYSLDGTQMNITYPNDFHDGTLKTDFLEISKLPTDVMNKILSYGAGGGKKRRKTRGKKRSMKRKSRKHN